MLLKILESMAQINIRIKIFNPPIFAVGARGVSLGLELNLHKLLYKMVQQFTLPLMVFESTFLCTQHYQLWMSLSSPPHSIG